MSLPLSLSIVYGIAIFRVIQQDAKRRQNRRSLSELKEEEDRIRMGIISAAQSLAESPFSDFAAPSNPLPAHCSPARTTAILG